MRSGGRRGNHRLARSESHLDTFEECCRAGRCHGRSGQRRVPRRDRGGARRDSWFRWTATRPLRSARLAVAQGGRDARHRQHRRAASVEHGLHMGGPHRAVPTLTAEQVGAVRPRRLRRRARRASTPSRWPRSSPRSTGSRPRPRRSSRGQDGRAHRDRRAGRDHVHDPPRRPVAAARAACARTRRSSASAPTSIGPTSTSTGTRPCTRSRRSRAGSRGTRTTATRSSSRSSTSRAGWRSPTPPSTTAARGSCPGSHRRGHARAPLRRPARLGVPQRPRRRRSCAEVPRRRRRGVLVAHPAPDRAEHAPTRCARPTSSSTPRRRRGPPRRPERSAGNSDPRRPRAATRSSVAARPA